MQRSWDHHLSEEGRGWVIYKLKYMAELYSENLAICNPLESCWDTSIFPDIKYTFAFAGLTWEDMAVR